MTGDFFKDWRWHFLKHASPDVVVTEHVTVLNGALLDLDIKTVSVGLEDAADALNLGSVLDAGGELHEGGDYVLINGLGGVCAGEDGCEEVDYVRFLNLDDKFLFFIVPSL